MFFFFLIEVLVWLRRYCYFLLVGKKFKERLDNVSIDIYFFIYSDIDFYDVLD